MASHHADGQTSPFSDIEALRLDSKDIPVRKVETPAHRRRAKRREQLFVPPLPFVEVATALSGLSTSRAAALWLALKTQAKVDGETWLVPRLSFLAELGLRDRKARSRAISELERAGLVEVRRRLGKAPLLHLIPTAVHGEDRND